MMAEVIPLRSKEDASEFFGEGGFVSASLGEQLQRDWHVAVGEDGILYRYEGGVYRPDGEEHSRWRVREILGDRFKRRHAEEVITWLRFEPASIPSTPPTDRINVANGLIDWSTEALHPHTPEYRSAIQIPVNWNPDAKCSRFDEFLSEVLPSDQAANLVFEIFGYALFPQHHIHKAVMLLGPGRNGKSVLLAVMRALLGDVNVSAVPLQAFSESRFAAAQIHGKLANICGDLDARAVKQTDTYKMLTGGDPMTAEHKYKKQFKFISHALPIFSANEAPISSDQSAAWFERWIVLPMTRVIPEEKRDPRLIERLTCRDELEGVLRESIAGLRRVMERGRFALPESVQLAGADYRERLDTVSGFLADDCLTGGPSAFSARRDVYAAYKRWCEREGHRFPLRSAGVYQRLRERPEITEGARDGGIRGFRGLALLKSR